MSNRPIQVGDLVQVVRWPCCGYKLGRMFRVAAIEPPPKGSARCVECEFLHFSPADALENEDGKCGWTPVAFLKRIPPLSKLEGERSEEQLKEPA